MEEKKLSVSLGRNKLEIAAAYQGGTQDLLFFIHGLGCSKASFRDVWRRKDFEGFSILAIDLPGFGLSSRPEQFSYSMEDHARICEAILGEFPHQRLHVVCHSMGGAVGLLLSRETLESAASFANIEGNLVSEDCGLISRKTIGVPFEEFEKDFFPSFKARFADEEGVRMDLKLTDAQAFYQSSASLVDWSDSGELLGRFKALKCPKAYFYGARNAQLSVLGMLGGIRRIMICDSGHFAMQDNPESFYNKLGKFISH